MPVVQNKGLHVEVTCIFQPDETAELCLGNNMHLLPRYTHTCLIQWRYGRCLSLLIAGGRGEELSAGGDHIRSVRRTVLCGAGA